MAQPRLKIVQREGRDPEYLCDSETGEIVLIVHPAAGKENWLVSFATDDDPWKAFLSRDQAMAAAIEKFAIIIED